MYKWYCLLVTAWTEATKVQSQDSPMKFLLLAGFDIDTCGVLSMKDPRLHMAVWFSTDLLRDPIEHNLDLAEQRPKTVQNYAVPATMTPEGPSPFRWYPDL